MGKVRMVASEFETATRIVKNRGPNGRGPAAVEQGGFVLWQMAPDMWYVELAVGGSKVHAGSNGRLVWRHTPWLGSHAAKGPVRPLRRVLQVPTFPYLTRPSLKAQKQVANQLTVFLPTCNARVSIRSPRQACSRRRGASARRR
jgi:hypothetical protein